MPQTQVRPASDTQKTTAALGAVLVHAEPGEAAKRRVTVAASIAKMFGARLIGLGAEAMEPLPTMDPFGGSALAQWATVLQDQIGADLRDAEAAFRRDAAGADAEWRCIQDFPHRALCRTARAADLIVASPKSSESGSRAADPAEVVMASGRPVLIAPDADLAFSADKIVIAWKDTREARRAVADAMPFLQTAKDVLIHAVCDSQDVEAARFQVEDVAISLRRRGVPARVMVSQAHKEGVSHTLLESCEDMGATLIVAGAYGHSRFSEWAFGGVTDDLFRSGKVFVLFSH